MAVCGKGLNTCPAAQLDCVSCQARLLGHPNKASLGTTTSEILSPLKPFHRARLATLHWLWNRVAVGSLGSLRAG